MSKYLLPWKKGARRNSPVDYLFRRRQFVQDPKQWHRVYEVWTLNNKWFYDTETFRWFGTPGYDTAEEAMSALDQYLLSTGWVFISEERAQKLQLLF